ncbi:MAG: hypothetical protein ACRDOI_28830 [Trebonia sp.]
MRIPEAREAITHAVSARIVAGFEYDLRERQGQYPSGKPGSAADRNPGHDATRVPPVQAARLKIDYDSDRPDDHPRSPEAARRDGLCQHLHKHRQRGRALREDIPEPSTASGVLLAAVRASSQESDAARRGLNARQWVPGPAEERVASDLGPLIGLAMAAGGWELPEAPSAAPDPGAGAAVSLLVLFEAVYRPAQLLRRWQTEAPSWLRYPIGGDRGVTV